jgi:hypothetical protein
MFNRLEIIGVLYYWGFYRGIFMEEVGVYREISHGGSFSRGI